MLFIQYFGTPQTKELRKNKWSFIKQHPSYIVSCIGRSYFPILPQLFYWKEVTGSWIYKMGSKWDFYFHILGFFLDGKKGWLFILLYHFNNSWAVLLKTRI